MAEPTTFEPQWSVPPGRILAEALTDRGWSQVELARRTNRPVKTINEIVNGKAVITPDTAIQFELAMGVPARLWLNLERLYGEARARAASQKHLQQHVDWVDRFPVADLVKHEQLPRTKDKRVLLEALLRFLGASSPDAWERQWQSVNVALRRSRAFAPEPEAISAWLRWGEIEAAKLVAGTFDAQGVRDLLPQIRSLTRLDPIAFQVPLQTELARVGVLVLFLPEIGATRVSGAARWLNSETAAIQLSLRHKKDDQFWFALIHEIAHLLEGLRRRTYVDLEAAPDQDPDEVRADRFARDALIEPDAYEAFVRRGTFNAASVTSFARDAHIAPGIVVGRLQHDRHLAAGRLNYLKRDLNWA